MNVLIPLTRIKSRIWSVMQITYQIPCGLMIPNLKDNNKKINKINDIEILIVNALTVRFESPVSLMRKNKPLPRDAAIRIMTKIIKILVIICYTPEIAGFSRKSANLNEQ